MASFKLKSFLFMTSQPIITLKIVYFFMVINSDKNNCFNEYVLHAKPNVLNKVVIKQTL